MSTILPARSDAAEVPPRGRSRRRAIVWTAVSAVIVVAGSVIGTSVESERRLEEARAVSAVEQRLVDDAVAGAGELAAQIDAGRSAYREAAALWSDSEAAVAAWRTQVAVPAVEVPNPGGGGIPGGDERARALLDGIGGASVRLVFDAGPQNCGFRAAGDAAGTLALGGCYDSAFRDSLFLAWDSGVGVDAIWPVFVHEAMHWYQWDRYYTLFEAGTRAGIAETTYRPQVEADASCRAVVEHGVPREAYAATSAPCDVDGWHDGWLVEQLAALGVPTAAPDPAAFEVQEAIRP